MSRAALDDKLAFTRREAAEVTGYSVDIIQAAILSGELREVRPQVNGRRVSKGVILKVDLEAWLQAGAA